jgi:hypothetical protein
MAWQEEKLNKFFNNFILGLMEFIDSAEEK